MTFNELFSQHRLTSEERTQLVRFLALFRFEKTMKALLPDPATRATNHKESGK